MIEPLGNRVILTKKDIRPKTEFFVPEKDGEFGEVVVSKKGAPVKKGDVVAYDHGDFHEVDYEGNHYLIVEYDKLLARIYDH